MVIQGLLADFLAGVSFPLANTTVAGASSALGALLRKRSEAAQEIMLDELRHGRSSIPNIPDEDAAAIVFRYMRAATEGSARLNLRLMASVAAGQEGGMSTYADDFLRWADLLASLSRDEVILLAELHRAALTAKPETLETGEFWAAFKKDFCSRKTVGELQVEAIAGALLRTGLLRILGGLLDIGQAFTPSPLLQSMMSIADIEGVLRRDSAVNAAEEPARR